MGRGDRGRGGEQNEIKCVVCGKSKLVRRSWAKYCSTRCKAIGWGLLQYHKMTAVKK